MFARTVPSTTQLVGGATAACQKYGWKNIAVILSQAQQSTATAMEQGLIAAGIAVHLRYNVPFEGSVRPVLKDLKQLRILFLMPGSTGDHGNGCSTFWTMVWEVAAGASLLRDYPHLTACAATARGWVPTRGPMM